MSLYFWCHLLFSFMINVFLEFDSSDASYGFVSSDVYHAWPEIWDMHS